MRRNSLSIDTHLQLRHPRAGGAVIIVVISLMTTLLFLGLFFFNWSSQEVANAELFADPDVTGLPAVDPNPIFDMAAEQLVVGTRAGNMNSALWGGMHSLLAHQIGRIDGDLKPTDTNVGTGQGIRIEYQPGSDGYPELDANGRPVDDVNEFRFVYVDPSGSSVQRSIGDFVLNYSPLAQPNPGEFDGSNNLVLYDAFNQPDSNDRISVYRPDVDYTYPDHNSLFLAYDELAPVDPSNPIAGERRILIPSFFRPQLFPQYRGNSAAPGDFSALYTNTNHKGQIFRPHRETIYPDPGSVAEARRRRYLLANMTAESGDTTRDLKPFPFPSEGKMGIFTDTAGGDYEFLDVDLDGDGAKDSIWMDLDLPMVRLGDGKEFVPLVSFKVIDADGLLNVNAHGNLRGYLQAGNIIPPNNEPVSVSNQGMSRSEVNPLWALSGWPDASTSDSDLSDAARNVQDRFGTAPSSTMQLANMEWLMMLTGWQPQNVPGQAVLGRYGELSLISNGDLPRPGRTGDDDDQNNNRFGLAHNGFPGFVHPLSPVGTGLHGFTTFADLTRSYLTNGGAGATRRLGELATAGTGNPSRWPAYANFQSLAGSSLYPEDLMTPALGNSLVDDDAETVLERGSQLYGSYDSPFPSSESAFLQLSEEDLKNSPVASRISSLAAANFVHLPNAEQIRKRFTTDSWDRLEFNFTPQSSELGVMKPNNVDTEWEEADGKFVFPPYFNVSEDLQPFRRELRQLFRTLHQQDDPRDVPFGSNRLSPRHRLNLNGILSDDIASGGTAGSGTTGAFESGSPVYRSLIPHPETLSGDATVLDIPMYHGDSHNFVTGVGDSRVHFSNVTGADTYVQEWWARYDRQRLARDIYTLLWTLGRNNGANPTPEQAREMAQFAVNVVDAMDRDNVITRFEYSPDLIGGWNPTDVVYGIERQDLVFSEVLLIETADADSDSQRTLHKEDLGTGNGHRFLYIELRNSSPYPVELGDETWRLVRLPGDGNGTAIDIAVHFKSNGGTTKTIGPGETFVIGCHDGTVVNGAGQSIGSDFYVNIETDNNSDSLQAIVPIAEGASAEVADSSALPTNPLVDLDLTAPTGHPHLLFREFSPRDPSYTEGTTLVEPLIGGTGPGPEFTLALQRRRNLNAAGEGENVWIEVDRWTVRPQEFYDPDTTAMPPQPPVFTADETTSQAQLQAQLANLHSQERRHPFTATSEENPGSADRNHSLRSASHPEKNRGNDVWDDTDQMTAWHPHFDRDFSSVIELLAMPIFGYHVSGDAGYTSGFVAERNGGTVRNLYINERPSGVRTAGARFMNPADSYPSGHPFNGDALPHYRNRWYRLLEFVDVKSMNDQRMDQITAVTRRTPGKVNLNTIRDESVLAGLIDDPYHINPTGYANLTQDRIELTNRNWYLEHRRLRDGVDPLLASDSLDNIFIPGGFRARPYRSLSHLETPHLDGSGNPITDSADQSLQRTILRQRDTTNGHGLFEARAESDISQDTVDYHTKNRILAKIANNSTTRSNVFFVWVGVDLFEAHRNTDGFVQIGAKSDEFGSNQGNVPAYRMFCVVDMSRLEEAYNPLTGGFDFRKFIIHRQLLP